MQLVIKKTSFYSILLTFMIVLLPLSNLPFLSLSISSYTDEVIGMLSIIFLIKKLLNQKLKIYPGKICILLIIIGIIGFLSSLFSGLSRSILIQLFDYFLFIKPYVIFIAFLSIDESIKEKVITFLYPISKAIIWILFICSFVSQFIDIGMTIFTTNLLGIKINIFGFIWNNGIQTAWLAVGCFACICYKCKEKNKFKVYLLLYISILITIWGGFISMLFLVAYFYYGYLKNIKLKR